MPEPIPLVVHVTHEAGVKVGGIGAVLDGLLGASAYNTAVSRTVVAGPLNAIDSVEMERLTSPRNHLDIRYSSLHRIFDGVPAGQHAALQQVEQTYQVGVLYGTRLFGDCTHEVLLVDASNPDQQEVDSFKYFCWERYGLDCARYSANPEFNLYFAVAQPLFAALKAIGAGAGLGPNDKFVMSHEWMGMPLVFAAQLAEPGQWRTIFYAHEMATARRLVEERSGHDTAFYNALSKARRSNLNLETVYGSQDDLFKHPIIRLATRCDNIFAVGDRVAEELRFLGGRFTQANIDLVYNGVPVQVLTLAEKLDAKRRLQAYAKALIGYTPDYIFTHVSRLVISKAFWRDLRVLDHMDAMLRRAGKRALLFMLATSSPAGRRPEWVRVWEEQYGWPVGHRSDNGDLLDQEVDFFYEGLEPFNRRATNAQVVLVNQFGWSQDRCGQRMPAGMDFSDLRKGSDLEFGQSIYEPFGIAQLEPLTSGALSCVSNVCGCVGFVARTVGGVQKLPNLVVADYVTLPPGYWLGSAYDALAIDRGVRDWIETNNSYAAAQAILERLPQTAEDLQALLEAGYAAAERMSWEVVAHDFFMPGIMRSRK